MSGDTTTPIPGEAVEAAARAMYSLLNLDDDWDALIEDDKESYREMVRPSLAAAVPVLLATERERIATAIKAARDTLSLDPATRAGMTRAARIALTTTDSGDTDD